MRIWLGLVTGALAEKRVALVLAAEDYALVRPFTNRANDARAMEDLLEMLDFEVFVETNRDLRRAGVSVGVQANPAPRRSGR